MLLKVSFNQNDSVMHLTLPQCTATSGHYLLPRTLAQLHPRQVPSTQKQHLPSYLLRSQEVDVDVGIPSGRVDAVMAEVFTHILRGGLRQQPVNAFPWRKKQTQTMK